MSRVSLLEYDDRFGVMYPDAFHKCVLRYRVMVELLMLKLTLDWGAVLVASTGGLYRDHLSLTTSL